MAKGTCEVATCTDAIRKLGRWCDKHYQRWLRNGDPEGGAPYRDGAPMRWLLAMLERPPTWDCVLDWPHARSKDDYPSVPSGGSSRSRRASHVVLELTGRGPRPKGQECRHLCGQPLCLNPAHLTWGTPKENCADKKTHGTQPRGETHPRSKLTEDAVRDIRRRLIHGNKWHPGNAKDLAEEYGVSLRAVWAVGSRATWGWLD